MWIPKHKPVEDSDYFATLPANGLQMAEQTLREDLSILRENDLSTKDTVSGILQVQALQQSEVKS